jgi:pyridoxamine 5'-phosphate oxidase
MADDPFLQFERWFKTVHDAQTDEVNAMTLATVGADGQPRARVVLLKEVDDKGLVFFTNYESQKGQDLAHHPKASILFFWPAVERQIRIEGVVEKIDAMRSEAYFASRPRGSRLGAWSSRQSQVIASREVLEQAFEQVEARYHDQQIPMPPFWGGYRLIPHQFEFWQGRSNRLHDRLRYRLEDQRWVLERLSP